MSIRNLPSKIKVVMLKGEKGDKGDTGTGLPTGGTTGQVLKKASNTDYDYQWQNTDLPAGGTTGQVLKKTSNNNYEYDWVDEYYYDDSNALLKSNIAITRVPWASSGNVTVSAGSEQAIAFDIGALVSSADQVLGIQQYRLARDNYSDAKGLTIARTEITSNSQTVYYALYVYNPTDSDIGLSKAQTCIYLVSFS